MSHRMIGRRLPLAVLLAVVLAVAGSTAVAQDDERIRVEFFGFTNAMTDPDNDNDGTPDDRWQMQITVGATGGCVPEKAAMAYTSPWINTDDTVGVSLSTTECVFRIAARARLESRDECTFSAELAWADDDGNAVGDYADGSVLTSGRPAGESWLSARRDPDSGCARPHPIHFELDAAAGVSQTAGDEADLLARARRAAALGDYTLEVAPDAVQPAPGCDISGAFMLRGDRSSSSQTLGASGEACPSRASIVAAPSYVQTVWSDYVSFDAALPNIIVDLSPLVRMEVVRIAIVQDVSGSPGRAEASYTVTRSCGDETLPSPPAQAGSMPLAAGRWTVHSPDVPQFGPVDLYRALAASPTSDTVAGCSATVAVAVVGGSDGCAVSGADSRTLNSMAADSAGNLVFEFDFDCADATDAAAAASEAVEDEGADDMLPTEGQPVTEPPDGTDMLPVGDAAQSGDMFPVNGDSPPRDMPTG